MSKVIHSWNLLKLGFRPGWLSVMKPQSHVIPITWGHLQVPSPRSSTFSHVHAHTHACACTYTHLWLSLCSPPTKLPAQAPNQRPRDCRFPSPAPFPSSPQAARWAAPAIPTGCSHPQPRPGSKGKEVGAQEVSWGTGEGQRGWGTLTLKIRLSVALPAKWLENSRELQFGTHKL